MDSPIYCRLVNSCHKIFNNSPKSDPKTDNNKPTQRVELGEKGDGLETDERQEDQEETWDRLNAPPIVEVTRTRNRNGNVAK